MNPVTVLIPVGPQSEYLQWLPEAIESVLQQTKLPGEILLVDDGSQLTDGPATIRYHIKQLFPDVSSELEMHDGKWAFVYKEDGPWWVSYWRSPWNIGFSQAFNCGVGLSLYSNILYLASDDKLMPTAVEDCLKTWEDNSQKDAWYAMSYQVGADVHTIPNNAAMITRFLWRWMGGYPPSAFAGPDALMLSRLIAHAPDKIIKVAEGKANYWVREHPYQDTKRQFSFFAASGIMEVIRDMETRRFQPNMEVVLR